MEFEEDWETVFANASIVFSRTQNFSNLKLKKWEELVELEPKIRPSLDTLLIPGTTGFFCLMKYMEHVPHLFENVHLPLMMTIDRFRNIAHDGDALTKEAIYILDDLCDCTPKLRERIKRKKDNRVSFHESANVFSLDADEDDDDEDSETCDKSTIMSRMSKVVDNINNNDNVELDEMKVTTYDNNDKKHHEVKQKEGILTEIQDEKIKDDDETIVTESKINNKNQIDTIDDTKIVNNDKYLDSIVEEKSTDNEKKTEVKKVNGVENVINDDEKKQINIDIIYEKKENNELNDISIEILDKKQDNNETIIEIKTIPRKSSLLSSSIDCYHFGWEPLQKSEITKKLKDVIKLIFRGSLHNKCLDFMPKALLDLFTPHYDNFLTSKAYHNWIAVQECMLRPMNTNRFSRFRVLGKGAFGSVWQVRKLDTGAVLAMKEMKKSEIKELGSERHIWREREILKDINSPFVLNLHYSFQSSTNVYFLFDICEGGDIAYWLDHARHEYNHYSKRRDKLLKKIEKKSRPSIFSRKPALTPAESKILNTPAPLLGLSEERARFYAAEILLALDDIHDIGWIYRDLKPSNVLLRLNGHCCLSDLGLAIKKMSDKKITSCAGTPGFWAPEVLSQTVTDTFSDIWSWGCFLYVMLYGQLPMCNCDMEHGEWCSFESDTNRRKFRGEPVPFDRCPTGISFIANDLLCKIFVHYDKRITSSEIKLHPFFSTIDWKLLRQETLHPPFIPDVNQVHCVDMLSIGEEDICRPNDNETHAIEWSDFIYQSKEVMEAEFEKCLKLNDAKPRDDENIDEECLCCGCIIM